MTYTNRRKLTPRMVRMIRLAKVHKTRGLAATLARKYRVSRACIHNVAKGLTYADVG